MKPRQPFRAQQLERKRCQFQQAPSQGLGDVERSFLDETSATPGQRFFSLKETRCRQKH